MSKALAAILIFIGWVTLCWGCFSFYYLDVNPKIWGDEARAMMAMLGIFIGAIVSILAYLNKEETP